MTREEVIAEVKKLNLPLGQYLIVGGGVSAVHGIRNTNDLDIVVSAELFEILKQNGWPLDAEYRTRWNRDRLKRGAVEIHQDFLFENNSSESLAELLANADIIEGVPFQKVEHLLKVKRQALREKDAEDVKLLESYLKQKK